MSESSPSLDRASLRSTRAPAVRQSDGSTTTACFPNVPRSISGTSCMTRGWGLAFREESSLTFEPSPSTGRGERLHR